jgi:hypothetical protein
MNDKTQWQKVFAEKAGDIIDAGDLEPESAALLKPEDRPEELIRKLSEAKLWPDAIKVMTRSLPSREAIWWACVCARQMDAVAGSEGEAAALEAAEKWVFKPSDDNRRAAFDVAQDNESPSAGSLAAFSVAFSGGNIPSGDDDYVDMDPAAFAQTVDAAVMVSACEKKGQELHEQFARFLRSGEDIACGGNGAID